MSVSSKKAYTRYYYSSSKTSIFRRIDITSWGCGKTGSSVRFRNFFIGPVGSFPSQRTLIASDSAFLLQALSTSDFMASISFLFRFVLLLSFIYYLKFFMIIPCGMAFFCSKSFFLWQWIISQEGNFVLFIRDFSIDGGTNCNGYSDNCLFKMRKSSFKQ